MVEGIEARGAPLLVRSDDQIEAVPAGEVVPEVQEGAVNARLVYTPDERYAFLLEKNPFLDDFRREFQLDIE